MIVEKRSFRQGGLFLSYKKKAEINKNIKSDVQVIGDIKAVLSILSKRFEQQNHSEWLKEVKALIEKYPLTYDKDVLTGPGVIEKIYELTGGDAIITTEVGQHQMWTAQFYKFTKPRTFLSSGGLGTMGYGLGASLGAKMGCPKHLEVIEAQKKRLVTTKGFVAVKPNCSIQSYASALYALREFESDEVVATTYKAISDAGKTFKDWPEMVENIIPYIGGEEEKSEQEPLRIFGKVEDGVIVKAAEPKITTQCIRVPLLNGHIAAVFVKFRKKPTKDEIIERWVNFKGLPQELDLPTAPKQFIQYMEEDNRPQVQ